MPGRPHGCDLRKGRFSQLGRIYLVTTVTRQRKPLFTNIILGRVVVNTLRNESGRATTLAYVVMPDHLHWLFQLEANIPLDREMQAVKSVSGHRINRHHGRKGRV